MFHDHQLIVKGVKLDFQPSFDALDEAIKEIRNVTLQPPKKMDAVEWIESHIELPKSKSERPGLVKLTGYQKEFIRFYEDETTKEIVVTKGARVGISLVMSFLAAFKLAYQGKHVTISQPTHADAKAFARDRIEALFEMCPELGALRRPHTKAESQDSWGEIHFRNGAILRIIGAVKDDNFRRYGSENNFMDEYSAEGYAPRSKTQGDKALLFMERGGEYMFPKLVVISTPLGKENCRTTARYEESNKCEPWISCPHCGTEQVMEWGDRDSTFGFKWKKDQHGFVSECWYQCVNGCEIRREEHLDHLDATTQYRPKQFWKVPGRVGMYVPQWFSYAGQADWKNLAQRFLSAQGNPEYLKTFINNVKGVAYDDFALSSLEAADINRIIKAYPAEVPDDVVLLTCGVDTQRNKEGSELFELASREAMVVGWTRVGQFRIIGHWIIEGSPGDVNADARMAALINRKFKRRDGTEVPIMATAMDLGGGFADETKMFASRFKPRQGVWAIKGRNTRKGERGTSVWPKRASRNEKTGLQHYMIETGLAKDAIFRLLQLVGDSAPMAPPSMGISFLTKLMCEERKKKGDGLYWQAKKGMRSEEVWDCLVYAYAALKGLQWTWPLDWRDLNLAADYFRIPTVSDDPVTGEIGYVGPDMSAHAQEEAQKDKDGTRQLDEGAKPTLADLPVPKVTPHKEAKAAEPQVQRAVPTAEVEQPKVKRKTWRGSAGRLFG